MRPVLPPARALAAHLSATVGAHVELTIAPTGLLVSGPSADVVARAADALLPTLRRIDADARLRTTGRDESGDEPEGTAFFASIVVDFGARDRAGRRAA